MSDTRFIKKFVVVTLKQNNHKSQLHALRHYLSKHMNPNNISIDLNNMEILIENLPLKSVWKFVNKYKRGLSYGGHGGYRFEVNVTEREVNLVERLANVKAQRDALEQELESERQEKVRLEEKWGDDRQGYKRGIETLSGRLKQRKAEIKGLEKEMEEITTEMKRDKRALLEVIHRMRVRPLWRISWGRLIRLVNG